MAKIRKILFLIFVGLVLTTLFNDQKPRNFQISDCSNVHDWSRAPTQSNHGFELKSLFLKWFKNFKASDWSASDRSQNSSCSTNFTQSERQYGYVCWVDIHKYGQTIYDWPMDTNQSGNGFECVGLLEARNLDLFISICGLYCSANFSQSEGVFGQIDEINLDIISDYEKDGHKTDVPDWSVDFGIVNWNSQFVFIHALPIIFAVLQIIAQKVNFLVIFIEK